MNLHTFAFAGFALLAAGCGAPATVNGTIAGDALPPTDAISSVVNLTSGNLTLGTVGAIVISTESGSCDLTTARQVSKNSKFLVVSVGNLDSSHLKLNAPTAPGTFKVVTLGSTLPSTSGVAFVRYTKDDATCTHVGNPIDGSSGSVTLTAASDGAYSGSGDVMLTSGDHITFEFDAAHCSALADIVNDPNAGSTCL